MWCLVAGFLVPLVVVNQCPRYRSLKNIPWLWPEIEAAQNMAQSSRQPDRKASTIFRQRTWGPCGNRFRALGCGMLVWGVAVQSFRKPGTGVRIHGVAVLVAIAAWRPRKRLEVGAAARRTNTPPAWHDQTSPRFVLMSSHTSAIPQHTAAGKCKKTDHNFVRTPSLYEPLL